VRRIVGEALATNGKMISLARKAGFTIRSSPDFRGLMLLERALDAPLPGAACAEAAPLAA